MTRPGSCLEGDASEKMLWRQRNGSRSVPGRRGRPGLFADGETAGRSACWKMDRNQMHVSKITFWKESFSCKCGLVLLKTVMSGGGGHR